MKSILEMIFKTGAGKTFKLTFDNPREDITPLEIETAMDLVITKDIFSVEGGLTEVFGANIVTTETQVIDFV